MGADNFSWTMVGRGQEERQDMERKVAKAAVAYVKLRNSGGNYLPVGSRSAEGKALLEACNELTKAIPSY